MECLDWSRKAPCYPDWARWTCPTESCTGDPECHSEACPFEPFCHGVSTGARVLHWRRKECGKDFGDCESSKLRCLPGGVGHCIAVAPERRATCRFNPYRERSIPSGSDCLSLSWEDEGSWNGSHVEWEILCLMMTLWDFTSNPRREINQYLSPLGTLDPSATISSTTPRKFLISSRFVRSGCSFGTSLRDTSQKPDPATSLLTVLWSRYSSSLKTEGHCAKKRAAQRWRLMNTPFRPGQGRHWCLQNPEACQWCGRRGRPWWWVLEVYLQGYGAPPGNFTRWQGSQCGRQRVGSVSSGRLILERVEVQIGVGLLHRLLDVFAYQTLSSSVITSFMTDRVCGMLIFFEVFYS